MKYLNLALLLLFFSCSRKEKSDLLIYNAHVCTVDSVLNNVEAFAVKDGKFIAVGKSADLLKRFESAKTIDAKGAFIYPGFLDAHCHFYSYGRFKSQADLTGSKSFEEVLERVKRYAEENKSTWITGRGWDQNIWADKSFPERGKLDSFFPDRPVYLSRVDGHAALVNNAALKIAGFNEKTKIPGGRLEVKNGRLTGVLIDNAADSIKNLIPKPPGNEAVAYLDKAQEDCFAVGLTTVDDAGLDKQITDLMDSLQKAGRLKMRVYAMLNPTEENLNYYLAKGPYKTDRLHLCSFKFYADGALGSRGACLLSPYSDKPDQTGFLLHPVDYYYGMAKRLAASQFQMNTHCIGDSGNRLLLKVYAAALKVKNDRRWRIEHAQVVHSEDVPLFGKFNIIPSVQPTHATSDMGWAGDRLGHDRVNYAYAYKDLLKQNGMVANGSDFPVESINPLLGFYAAVWRVDKEGNPSGGFQPENALSREEALKAMTIWAAYANFEEKEKGSIEPGKLADFVFLNGDLLKVSREEALKLKVQETWIGGERVYKQP